MKKKKPDQWLVIWEKGKGRKTAKHWNLTFLQSITKRKEQHHEQNTH